MIPVQKRIEETRNLIQRHLKLKEGAKKVLENPEATQKNIEQAQTLIKTLNSEIEEFRAELYTLMAQVSVPEFENADSEEIENQNYEKLINYYKKQLKIENEVKLGIRKMMEASNQKTESVNNELIILYHDAIIKVEYLRMLILIETQKKNQKRLSNDRLDAIDEETKDLDGFNLPRFIDLTTDKIKERYQNAIKMLQGAVEIKSQESPKCQKRSLQPSTQTDELIEFLSQLVIIHERTLKKHQKNPNNEINEDVRMLENYSKNSVVSGSLQAKFYGITDIDEEMIRDSKALTKTRNRLNSGETSQLSVFVTVDIDNKTVYTSPNLTCSRFCIDSEFFEFNLLKNKNLQFVVKSSVSHAMVAFNALTLLEFLDGEPHKIKIPLEPQGYLYASFQYFMPRPRKAKVIRQKKIFIKSHAIVDNGTKMTDENLIEFVKGFRKAEPIKFETQEHVRKISTAKYKPPNIEKDRTDSDKAQDILRGIYEEEISNRQTHDINLDSFKLISVLGQGHFGKVLLAEFSKTKKRVAVKTMTKISIVESNDFEMLSIEKRVLMLATEFNHPFLLHLLACFTSENHIIYALEYISAGDLMSHIHIELFNESRCIFYSACVLLALEFMHENGVLYRDLKLDNILMEADGYVKIGDFGLCKTNVWFGTKTSTFCGTPEFIAPEILQFPSYNRAVDWWELGVLIYEMLLGEAPFDGSDENEIFHSIVYDDVVLPSYLSSNARNIIYQLLEKNPDARLGAGVTDAAEIKPHPFFSIIDFDSLFHKNIKPEYVPNFNQGELTFVEKEFSSSKPVLEKPQGRLTHLEPEQEKFFNCFYYSSS